MRQTDRVTLLLEGTAPTTDWNTVGEPGQIVRVPSFRILDGAVAMGLNELGIEIEAIVIDRAVDEGELLDFLCQLLTEFRGDVLAIMQDGSAYLSTLSRGDGRLIHRLGSKDIEFYLFTRFGLSGAVCAPSSAMEH
jgi:hypothetical protein